VQVIVEHNGRRESGYAGGGGRYGYEELFAEGARKPSPGGAAPGAGEPGRHPAPAGVMPVAPGWPGVLLHEAVGHGWKATSTARAPASTPAASASAWPRRA
jgi:TldD protein